MLAIGYVALADTPATPANFTASSTSPTTVNLNWSTSTNSVSYQVYKNNISNLIATTSNEYYNDTGLTPATTYTYYLSATDASSTKSGYAWVTFTTLADISAPSVPKNLSAYPVSPNQINLSWTASSDNVAIAGYKIFRDGSQIGTTSSLYFYDTGLTSSTTYNYKIKSYDTSNNESGFSSSVSATTPTTDIIAPTIPTNLLATPISTTRIDLNWTVSTDNLAVAGYKIFKNEKLIGTSKSNFFSNIGLNASTTYTYKIKSYDFAGNISDFSSSTSATTLKEKPTTPGNVKIAILNGKEIGNTINLRSNGVVKLVVYGDNNLKVKDIKYRTVLLGGALAYNWMNKDINKDGKMDRIYYFRMRQMRDLVNTDTKVIFTAQTKSGTILTSEIAVKIKNSSKIKKVINDIKNKIKEKIEEKKQEIKSNKNEIKNIIKEIKTENKQEVKESINEINTIKKESKAEIKEIKKNNKK